MEKQTVFIKRYPIKGESPKHNKVYTTDLGEKIFSVSNNSFMSSFGMGQISPKWWLEEIEILSEDNLPTNVALHHKTMYHDNNLQEAWNKGVIMCYDFILNHLKSNTNETDKT